MVLKTLSLGAVAATGLAGCAGLPTPRSDGIHFALAIDASMRELASQCQKVSPQCAAQITQTQRNWWLRNGAVVSAADYGLWQTYWDPHSVPIDEQRYYFSMQLLEMVQTDADAQVNDWLSDRASRNCGDKLAVLQEGEYDLDRNADHFETLFAFHNDQKDRMSDVSQARVINTRYRRYGRSLLIVEQRLQGLGCNHPQISMLRNEWSLEVYDAVCSDRSYVLIQCEWGRCDVR